MQGVGFRYAAWKKAKTLNILGFVKNEPDGSLYIEAAGEELDLNKFVAWCGKGPVFARVDDIKSQEIKVKQYGSFEIM